MLDDGTIVYPRARPAAALLAGAVEPVEPTTPWVPEPLPRHQRIEVVRPSSAFTPADADRALETAAESIGDAELARRKGIALHALLQHLTRIPPADRERIAQKALAALLPEDPGEHDGLVRKAIGILATPGFARIFGPESRAEVPFLATASRHGTPIRLAGRIDRLVVSSERVLVVDFKSDAIERPAVANVKEAYLTQLGLYARVAKELFPGRAVEAGILWTDPETLTILPAPSLLAAVDSFTMA
jgi:ATP-dependent helicase/nuclease subunit A